MPQPTVKKSKIVFCLHALPRCKMEADWGEDGHQNGRDRVECHSRKHDVPRPVRMDEPDRGELYPVYATKIKTIAQLGPGIGVYFIQLNDFGTMMAVFAAVQLIAAFYGYWNADYNDEVPAANAAASIINSINSSSSNGFTNRLLSISAGCTETLIVNATRGCGSTDDGSDAWCIASYRPTCELPTTAAFVDLVICILFVVAMYIAKHYESRMLRRADKGSVTTRDFSVTITDPPTDAENPDEYKDFFAQFGVVQSVTVVRRNVELRALLMKKHALLQRRREEEEEAEEERQLLRAEALAEQQPINQQRGTVESSDRSNTSKSLKIVPLDGIADGGAVEQGAVADGGTVSDPNNAPTYVHQHDPNDQLENLRTKKRAKKTQNRLRTIVQSTLKLCKRSTQADLDRQIDALLRKAEKTAQFLAHKKLDVEGTNTPNANNKPRRRRNSVSFLSLLSSSCPRFPTIGTANNSEDPYFPVERVYVTFVHSESRMRCLRAMEVPDISAVAETAYRVLYDPELINNMQQRGLLFRNREILNVKSCAEPEGIIWENLEISASERWVRSWFATAVVVLALVGSAVFVAYVRDASGCARSFDSGSPGDESVCSDSSQLLVSFAIAALDPAFRTIIGVAVPFTSPIHTSARERLLQMMLFGARIVSTVLIPYAVLYPWNSFLDHVVLLQIINTLVISSVVNTPLDFVDIAGTLQRYIIAPLFSDTQAEVNAVWINTSQWSLATRFTDMSRLIFYAVLYMTILPTISLGLGALALIVMFFEHKYFLFRRWTTSDRQWSLDEDMNFLVRQQALLAVAVHMYVTLRFIYSWPMDEAREVVGSNAVGAAGGMDPVFERVDKFPSWRVWELQVEDWHTEAQKQVLVVYFVVFVVIGVVAFYQMVVRPCRELWRVWFEVEFPSPKPTAAAGTASAAAGPFTTVGNSLPRETVDSIVEVAKTTSIAQEEYSTEQPAYIAGRAYSTAAADSASAPDTYPEAAQTKNSPISGTAAAAAVNNRKAGPTFGELTHLQYYVPITDILGDSQPDVLCLHLVNVPTNRLPFLRCGADALFSSGSSSSSSSYSENTVHKDDTLKEDKNEVAQSRSSDEDIEADVPPRSGSASPNTYAHLVQTGVNVVGGAAGERVLGSKKKIEPLSEENGGKIVNLAKFLDEKHHARVLSIVKEYCVGPRNA